MLANVAIVLAPGASNVGQSANKLRLQVSARSVGPSCASMALLLALTGSSVADCLPSLAAGPNIAGCHIARLRFSGARRIARLPHPAP